MKTILIYLFKFDILLEIIFNHIKKLLKIIAKLIFLCFE